VGVEATTESKTVTVRARKGVIFAVERADSTWPDRFALQLTGGADPPLEVLSAARMREIGKPFSLMTVTW